MNISLYLEQALLNAVFRGVAFTSPASLYIALYTADPTAVDTGTEVSGGGYARQSVAFTAPVEVGGASQIENTADIQFPIASADWGNITHIGIRDALTDGNLLYHGALTNPRTILTSDRITFLIGEIVVGLD